MGKKGPVAKKGKCEVPYNKETYYRDWARKNRLSVGNGEYIYLEKRDFPQDNNCELCHKQRTKLEYHHWDKEWPEAGLWLCIHCHKIAEAYEQGIIEQYQQLKTKVEEEVAVRDLPAAVREAIGAGTT